MTFQILLSFLLVSLLVSTIESKKVVKTKYGRIRGFTTDLARCFYGVPYAAPPVGSKRWKPTQAPSSWSGILNAKVHKPACSQSPCGAAPDGTCQEEDDEDCLYLNIWTPLSAKTSSSLPVMVFIHGGNFLWYSASAPIFDGEYISNKGNVVVVALNYRLGLLGFMYTGTSADDANGNYGILDQRQALKWVRQNIQGFGGDKKKITIFGQSAGAQSILVHMMSGKSDKYFHKAIVQSAPATINFKTQAQALTAATAAATHLGCNVTDLNCMRSKTVVEILDAQGVAGAVTTDDFLQQFEPIGPVIDGDEVPMQIVEAAENGIMRNIPTMIGTVTEEGRSYIYGVWTEPMNAVVYAFVLATIFPESWADVYSKYPCILGDCRDILAQATTDYVFMCVSRKVERDLIEYGSKKTYLYIFDQSFSFPGWGNGSYSMCNDHVCHANDLPYIFHTVSLAGYNFTAEEEDLSNSMVTYWTNFAHSSNPNVGPTSPSRKWPLYKKANWRSLYFQTPANTIAKNFRNGFCNLFDSLGYTM